jgi:hypothetical protein
MSMAPGSRRIAIAGALGAAVVLAWTSAFAQFGAEPWRRAPPRQAPQAQFNPFGGMFEQLWQVPAPGPRRTKRPPSRAKLGDFSKPPPARKPNADAKTRILVIGDAMADWLGHGLQEAYEDEPDVAVLRAIRRNAGLIPGKRRDAPEWIDAAPGLVTEERADIVVVMLGLSDRTSFPEAIEERPRADTSTPGEPRAKPESGRVRFAQRAFRSDRWRELYAKRIDETIAALKRTGVPLFWVGLPPIQGPRSRSEIAVLNDLYRARAERAGIGYVDVWDGFMGEDGKFSIRGPDYDGQTRQLRSLDGVYFTKAGALKLGHYAEREIQPAIAARAVPPVVVGPQPGQAAGEAAPRPAAGPVLPLTESDYPSQELAGKGRAASAPPSPLARRVLMQGKAVRAVPGRADDFSWPVEARDVPAGAPVAR